MLASVQNVCTWRNLLLQEFSGNSLVEFGLEKNTVRLTMQFHHCITSNAMQWFRSLLCPQDLRPESLPFSGRSTWEQWNTKIGGQFQKNSFFIYERENNLQRILPCVNKYYPVKSTSITQTNSNSHDYGAFEFWNARWGVAEWIERPLLMLEVRGSNPGHSASKIPLLYPEA